MNEPTIPSGSDPARTSRAASSSPGAAEHSPLDRTLLVAVLAAVGLAVFAFVSASSLRNPSNAISVALILADSGPRAAAYLGACVGWGLLLVRAIPALHKADDRSLIAVALGTCLMLTLSHLLGVSGVFGFERSRLFAAAPVIVGLVALLAPIVRALHIGIDLTELFTPTPAILRASIASAWIAGVSMLVVAACNPPGALWASEFGGYDSLSYHLQLPREWLASGVLTPLTHNVYSYLPGYVESAFLHLGALTGSRDFLTGHGSVLLSCHLLHAGFAALSAWCVGRAARAMALHAGITTAVADVAGAITAAMIITVPWSVVVGSLAYNEMPMLLLLASACAVALPGAMSPIVRGVLIGLFVGVACGVKPTALILGAPAVGLVMLGASPRRSWLALLAGACGAGLLALVPWLVRNHLAGGNPVFPQLAGVFGSAHWSAEQLARYASAHRFDGSVLERLGLILLPDSADPAATASNPVHRGLAHPQWLPFAPIVLVSAAVACASVRVRRLAVIVLAAIGVQMLAWLALTHIQSRFLVPIIATGGALVGLALGALIDSPPPFAATGSARASRLRPIPRRVGVVLPSAMLLASAAWIVILFAREQTGGVRNALLTPGPGLLSGSLYKEVIGGMDEAQRRELLADAPPNVYCNLALRDDDTLYLLGDSTPLYFTCRVIYHTTYDASPLAEAIRDRPESAESWVAALSSRGITHVLVNLHEIERLARSGWLDPSITPGAIEAGFFRGAAIVRTWDQQRIVLFALPPARRTPTTPTTSTPPFERGSSP